VAGFLADGSDVPVVGQTLGCTVVCKPEFTGLNAENGVKANEVAQTELM
jgi:hypothetical protein